MEEEESRCEYWRCLINCSSTVGEVDRSSCWNVSGTELTEWQSRRGESKVNCSSMRPSTCSIDRLSICALSDACTRTILSSAGRITFSHCHNYPRWQSLFFAANFQHCGNNAAKLPLGTSNLSDSLHGPEVCKRWNKLKKSSLAVQRRATGWGKERESVVSAPHLHWTLSGSETMHSRISGAEEQPSFMLNTDQQGKHSYFLRFWTVDVSINCVSVKLTTDHSQWKGNLKKCATFSSPLWTVGGVVSSIIWSGSLTQRSDTCKSLWANALVDQCWGECFSLLSIRTATNLPLAIDTTWPYQSVL